VNYLHEDRKIVNWDIKPENILFSSKDMNVKLTDFTVAKVF